MKSNTLTTAWASLCAMAAITFLLPSCGSKKQPVETTNIQVIQQSSAADGLDLRAVGDLVTTTKTAEELEKKLNIPGNKINNLDLNEDDKVDYIKVTEFKNKDIYGFSLTTELDKDKKEEQEIATIQIEKDVNDTVKVQTHGNSSIYGNNHYHYRSGISMGDMLIMGYLLSNHTPYYSPWGWNRYPNHYSSRRPMRHDQYRSYHKNKPYAKSMRTSKSSSLSRSVKSPNYNKSASKVKAPLKNPTTSQRAFQKRNPSKTVSKGGFGRKSSSASTSSSRASSTRSRTSSTRSSRPSVRRSSSFGRSRSSFGGGK